MNRIVRLVFVAGLPLILVTWSWAAEPNRKQAMPAPDLEGQPTKFEKFNVGDPDDMPPTELDVDPTLEPPSHNPSPAPSRPPSAPTPSGTNGPSPAP